MRPFSCLPVVLRQKSFMMVLRDGWALLSVSRGNTSKSMLYTFFPHPHTLRFNQESSDVKWKKNYFSTCTLHYSMLPEQHKFEKQARRKKWIAIRKWKCLLLMREKRKKFLCFNTTRRLINSWTMNKVHTHTLKTRFFLCLVGGKMRYSVCLSLNPYPSNFCFCDTEISLYCKFISKIMVSGYMSRTTKKRSKIMRKNNVLFSLAAVGVRRRQN